MALAALVGGTALSFFQGRYKRLANDGRYYYAWVVSLAVDQDLDCANQYETPGIGNHYSLGPTQTGVTDNRFPIGTAILWLPFWGAGHALAQLLEAPEVAADPVSPWHVAVTTWSSFLFGLGATLFAFGVVRRRFSDGPAFAAAVVAMTCGPVLIHVLMRPSYSHAASAFVVAAFFWLWDRDDDEERSTRTWLGLGALFGLAMLVRPQNVVFGLPLVVDGIASLRRGPKALLQPLLCALVAFAVFLPQLLINHWMYGAWLVVPQEQTGWEAYMRWTDPAWSEVLFSSRNGLFPWAPLWALGVAGMFVFAWREPRAGLVAVGTFLLTTWINGAAADWWGEGAFGGRRFDGQLVPIALGLGLVASSLVDLVLWKPRRAAAWGLGAATAIAAVFGVAVTEHAHLYNNTKRASDTATNYAETLRDIARDSLWKLGNPMSWPASIAFWWRTGAEPARYDVVVGTHFLGDLPVLGQLARDRLAFADPDHRKYVVAGVAEDGTATEAEVRVLVPLNTPRAISARLVGEAFAKQELVVRWNDAEMIRQVVEPGPFSLPFLVDPTVITRSVNVVDVHQGRPAVRYDALLLEELASPASRPPP